MGGGLLPEDAAGPRRPAGPADRAGLAASARTFGRVFRKIDADALNQALYGYLEAMPPAAAGGLPEVIRHEREQRRATAAARKPAVPGLLPQAAADGKTARGAVRPDGSQVHLLSAFHVPEGRTMAQREVDAKTNEIPELGPTLEGLDLAGMVITADALHGQRETARMITRGSRRALRPVHQGEPAVPAGRHHGQAQRHRRRVRGHHLD